jgi:hypothetical protein
MSGVCIGLAARIPEKVFVIVVGVYVRWVVERRIRNFGSTSTLCEIVAVFATKN